MIMCLCCDGVAVCFQRTKMNMDNAQWSAWEPRCEAWAGYEERLGRELGFRVERKPIQDPALYPTLPTIVICAWCRNMARPMDKQDGWRTITKEDMSQEDGASHGMCPECAFREMRRLSWRGLHK